MKPRALALLLISLLFAPVWAQAGKSIRVETQHSSTPNGKAAAALVVNGRIVAQLAKPQRGKEPLDCISVAAALVAQAYRLGQAQLKVQASDDSQRRFALYLNGKVLLVATDEEGKAWGVEPQKLAQTWRNNLDQAWGGLPPAPDSPGGKPTGAAPADKPDGSGGDGKPAGPPGAGLLDAGTATVHSDPDYANLMVLSGQHVFEAPGETQLDHAVLLPKLTAEVTGATVSEQARRAAVDNALRVYAGTKASDNLRWAVTEPADGSLSVPRDGRVQLKVSYTTTGEDPLASGQSVALVLENRTLAVPRETLTFFSNNPETITEPQLLYYAELPARQAGRLVLHHQNQSRNELQLIARVINNGSEASAVHVVPGMCAADINTFLVGFRSAETFWFNLNHGNGYVLSLPAGRQAYILQQRLPAGYTSSAYYKLTNLGSTPLRIETVCLEPWAHTPEGPLSGDGRASRGVYPAPYVTQTADYTTGDDWLYLRLGQDSPGSLVDGDGSRFDGSYGVTYSFNVQLTNDTDQPALLFVVLRASAGEVKGQFFIDDEYVATPLISGGEEQLLKEIPLKPGQTKLLKIKAMPLNGGFYPASIVVRESRYP